MLDHLFGPMTQLGYVVDDLEATARMWTETSGVGPWTRMKNVTLNATVDGKPSEILIDLALAYKGDMQIELIKPLNDVPSPYLEYKKAGISSIHHVQFEADDMEAALETAKAAGLEIACTINQGGGVYHYLRGPGIWFELFKVTDEGLLGLFQMIKSSSENWDGKDIIRDMSL